MLDNFIQSSPSRSPGRGRILSLQRAQTTAQIKRRRLLQPYSDRQEIQMLPKRVIPKCDLTNSKIITSLNQSKRQSIQDVAYEQNKSIINQILRYKISSRMTSNLVQPYTLKDKTNSLINNFTALKGFKNQSLNSIIDYSKLRPQKQFILDTEPKEQEIDLKQQELEMSQQLTEILKQIEMLNHETERVRKELISKNTIIQNYEILIQEQDENYQQKVVNLKKKYSIPLFVEDAKIISVPYTARKILLDEQFNQLVVDLKKNRKKENDELANLHCSIRQILSQIQSLTLQKRNTREKLSVIMSRVIKTSQEYLIPKIKFCIMNQIQIYDYAFQRFDPEQIELMQRRATLELKQEKLQSEMKSLNDPQWIEEYQKKLQQIELEIKSIEGKLINSGPLTDLFIPKENKSRRVYKHFKIFDKRNKSCV